MPKKEMSQFEKDCRGAGRFIFYLMFLPALRFLLRKDYYHNYYLTISFNGWKPKFTWINHNQYVTKKAEKLAKLKIKQSPKKFIKSVLTDRYNCNFVKFDCGDKNKFIQFWLGDGKIEAVFIITKENHLLRYKYPVLGLLSEMGFYQCTKDNKGKYLKLYKSYYCKKSSDYTEYCFNFIDDEILARDFTVKLFEMIFKQKLENLEFEMG